MQILKEHMLFEEKIDGSRKGMVMIMAVEEKELSLEENFGRLEAIMERLESDEISLEDAFQAYSAGMELLKTCSDQIDRVEKQVLKLTEEGELEAFEDGEQ